MADNRAGDSSDEDERVSITLGASAGGANTGAEGGAADATKRDELSRAWMDAEEEDEEEEDAEWSQLPPQSAAEASAAAAAVSSAAAAVEEKQEEPGSSLPADQEAKRSARFKAQWALVERDQWNTDAWLAIMGEAQTLPAAEARFYYERFLAVYPTSGRWWKLYAEHELREKQYDRVQEIIKKSLMQIRCPNVDLWLFYLNFTKVVQVDVAAASNDADAIRAARQLMCDAFELALERVGGSIHAAPLWQSYATFLQEDTHPQAFLAVRKLFHRAVTVPLNNMEAIWRDYEKFERGIPNNEALAANFFKVFRQKFDASRAVLRDRKKLYDAVSLHVLAVPVTKRNMRAELARISEWQKILAFETGNPERLDSVRWKSRVRFTFELFLSVHRHAPEAWFHYASFENDAQETDAATAVFERALEAIPSSSMLWFAFADHHELRGDTAAAKAVYERVLKENVSALAYITYQRFARRALGSKGLNEARTIFRRARKDEREGACTYHVFAAAALLEFYSDTSGTGREIALKIFELGLKKYIQEHDYVLCYLDFLGHLNDDNNMRSLFEKVLAVMAPELTRPIWDRYVEFEHKMVANGGDLATVAKVEARRALAFPDAPHVEIKGLLAIQHRYSFLDLRAAAPCDQLFLEKYGVGKRADEQNGHHENGSSNGFAGNDDGGYNPLDMPIPGPPVPDFLKEFAMMLPLLQPWNGPIADVEHIYRAMCLVDFPPRAQIEYLEAQKKQQIHFQQQQQQLLQQQQSENQRRDDHGAGEGDGAGVNVSSKRPPNDIFRTRQKLKLAKLA